MRVRRTPGGAPSEGIRTYTLFYKIRQMSRRNWADCVWELPNREKQLKDIEEQIKKERERRAKAIAEAAEEET